MFRSPVLLFALAGAVIALVPFPFAGGISAFAQAGNALSTVAPSTATDRLMVRYRKGAITLHEGLPPSERTRMVRAWTGADLNLHRAMSGERSDVYRLPGRRPLAEVEAIARRLREHPDIEYAVPDRISHVQFAPTDPSFSSQWALQSGSGGMNLPGAWEVTTGSPSVVIALLDTGILAHPDLDQARILSGYDFVQPDRANDGGGRDNLATDPGDWVTVEEAQVGAAFAGCKVMDSSWHGTAMAGAIMATPDNALGIAGINWQSKLLPVRVAGKCGAYASDIIDGMRWAAGIPVSGNTNPNPARVINLSLATAGACDPAYQSAITEVTRLGVTVVVAAGNAGQNAGLYSPASCSDVIAVGAVDRNGGLPVYSNTGTEVAVSAPGGDTQDGILSLSDSGTTVALNDGVYKPTQGTSIAAAQVSGVVSLMLSANPGLAPDEVKRLLQVSARGFPPAAGANAACSPSLCGSGIVDAHWAVATAQPFSHTKPRIAGSLALKDDGTVWAIGGAQVAGISAVKAIAQGSSHQLALRSDGTVWAWGSNASGQLGDGTLNDRSAPAPVGGLTGVVALAAGAAHSLALKSDGSVWAWGSWDGENRVAPVKVNGLAGIVAIRTSSSEQYSVALDSAGRLWHFNATSATSSFEARYVDAAVDDSGYVAVLKSDGTVSSDSGPGNSLKAVVALGSARSRLFAVLSDGSVWGWGDNSQGLLCDGTLTTPSSLKPAVAMRGAGSAVAVSGTSSATYVQRSDGSVLACQPGALVAQAVASFNAGVFDPTGFQARLDQLPGVWVESNPVTVQGIANGSAISIVGGEYRIGSGAYTSQAGVIDNGQQVTVRVFSAGFGEKAQAQLAIAGVIRAFSVATAALDARPAPIVFTAQANVAPGSVVESNTVTVGGINAPAAISIAGGEYRVNGGAYTSAPGSVNAGDAVQVRAVAGAANEFRQVSVTIGQGTSVFYVGAANDGQLKVKPQIAGDLALKDDGTLWAIGGAQVSGIGGVTAIARSSGHSLALRSDGTVWPWGSNGNGQLGDGTLLDRATPAPVQGVQDVVGVAAGSKYSFALKADGSVWVWGNWGEDNLTAPVKLSGLAGIASLHAAPKASHGSVALDASGRRWTVYPGSVTSSFDTGYVDAAIDDSGNSVALRSDGTLQSSSGQGDSLSGVVSVGAAGSRLYAVRSDGSLWGWGDNGEGLLCDGTLVTPEVFDPPARMQAMTSAARVSGMASSTYVLRSDGSVQSCLAGQLAPQAVAGLNLGVFDPAAFQAKLDQAPDTLIESNTVTLLGIANGSAISVAGGEYRIGGGAYTAQAGTIDNGQTVTLRLTLGDFGQTRQAQLTIAGVARTFSVTSAQLDATPEAMLFVPQANVAAGSAVESGSVTVTGINAPAAIGVVGGEYRINSGAYTSAAGSVNAGDTVQVRTSAGAANELKQATLTVGQSSTAFYVESAGELSVPARIAGDLALKDDGTVWQIGGAQVGALSGVKAIASGGNHQLAVRNDGSVWAWGANANGQLGDGTLASRNTPLPVTGLSDVVDVAAGYAHSLALKSDGTVWAWGAWDNANRTAPVRVSTLSAIVAIRTASSNQYSVARDSSGRLWTFSPTSAQPSFEVGFLDVAIDAFGRVLALKSDRTLQGDVGQWNAFSAVASVGSAGERLYAVLSDGSVWGWGDNAQGLLCDGTLATPDSLQPAVKMLGVSAAVAVSGTGAATYAVRSDGSVAACRNGHFAAQTLANFTLVDDDITPEPFNFSARMGVARNAWTESATVVMTGLGIAAPISVAGGEYSVNGAAYTNAAGQIANGDTLTLRVLSSESYSTAASASVTVGTYTTKFQVLTQTDPGAAEIAAMIAAGEATTFVLRHDGSVLAFGYNANGQLGNHGFLNRSTPSAVAGLSGAKAIAGGSYHVLAVRNDGSVWSWGWNGAGQLGDGSGDAAKREIVPVSGLADIKSVAAGYAHSLALGNDGTVWSWGMNGDGQLGDGSSARERRTPARVPGISGIIAIAAGERHSLALDANGNLYAWGANDQGQLGIGDGRRRSLTPVAVQLNGITAVASGGRHTLALRSDGSVWAWGDNSKGQLGDGTRVSRLSPAAVPRLRAGATRIGAGFAHSLAVANGNLYAWGRNNNGELGDGGREDRGEPVLLPDIAGVVALAAGARHSVALKSDGTVLIWGDNFYGQLGNRSGNYSTEALAADRLRGDGEITARGSSNISGEGQGSTGGNTIAPGDYPQSYDFGSVSVGATKEWIHPFENSYAGFLSSVRVEIQGSGFSVSNDCPYVMAARDICTVTVRFSPLLWGEASADIKFKGLKESGREASSPFSVSGFGVTSSTATTTTIQATSTTTTTATTTTTQPLALIQGWNLVGNGTNEVLDIGSIFGDENKVTTVWKWLASKGMWAFYTPKLTDGGAAYAASKGYAFLTAVGGGEGFWVNAITGFEAQWPLGTAIASTSFQGSDPGWHLIAVGDHPSASEFNRALSPSPPPAEEIPINVITLWAWEASLAKWYFYAPRLDASGTLGSYIQSKDYLDFGSKALEPATGFWINRP